MRPHMTQVKTRVIAPVQNETITSPFDNATYDTPPMTNNYRDITRSVSKSLRQLRADKPELIKSFNELAHAALDDGALSSKTKELIALCLGVAGHCDACIGFHMQALVKAGATRAEIEEALGVAVYMGGGPSLMYAANALSALEELTQPAEALA